MITNITYRLVLATLLVSALALIGCDKSGNDASGGDEKTNESSTVKPESDMDVAPGKGKFEVTGAVELEMETGHSIRQSDGVHTLLLFSPGIVVTMALPTDVSGGEYDLQPFESNAKDAYRAKFDYDPPMGGDKSNTGTYQASGGTLVITDAGETVSGHFKFPATDENSGAEVEVEGAFNQIPLPGDKKTNIGK